MINFETTVSRPKSPRLVGRRIRWFPTHGPRFIAAFSVALLATADRVHGDELVQPAEMATKSQWVSHTLLSSDNPVVSFLLDGKPSSEVMKGWPQSPIETKNLAGGRTQHRRVWTDPATHLEVSMVVVDYGDYPAVEWTAYLKNNGTKTTPIIDEIRGIDTRFGTTRDDVTLRTTQGDNYSAGGYAPLEFKLSEKAVSFQPNGGRPTNGAWPYFNIDCGRGGILLAVGWPGQWQAQFAKNEEGVSVRAGQETTHLRLLPGEEIRTPLIAVLFWKGDDWIMGQNLWRHWFLADNIPHPDNKLPAPFTQICPQNLHTSAAGDIAFLNSYLQVEPKPDYLWIDAGWYEAATVDWFAATGVGTWKPDPIRYPKGVREVSDYAHSKGLKFILWFEPERVYRGSYVWSNHPDWLLHWGEGEKGNHDIGLLNLGNPEARLWLSNYINQFITEQGVDLYRQDFNVDPLGAWTNTDAADRQGLTENLYVQGYLAYWDALLRAHPGMLIDSCASGGRRNDLETLRRAIPLLRSDYQALGVASRTTDVYDGNQGHTYGLSLWIPMFGTGEYGDDLYSARSHLCPWMGLGTQLDRPDWAGYRRQLSDHHQIADFFFGDYFPLTPYSKSEEVWMAWELVRSAQGDGVVQAFRRENCPITDIVLPLHGLREDARYQVTDLDSATASEYSGGELIHKGLRIYAASPRTALILTFKEVPPKS